MLFCHLQNLPHILYLEPTHSYNVSLPAPCYYLFPCGGSPLVNCKVCYQCWSLKTSKHSIWNTNPITVSIVLLVDCLVAGSKRIVIGWVRDLKRWSTNSEKDWLNRFCVYLTVQYSTIITIYICHDRCVSLEEYLKVLLRLMLWNMWKFASA